MNTLLHHYVTRAAERGGERRAIVWRGSALSYGELELRSNQLARLLRELGCERGDRVAILVPKSPPAIIGMIGALKAGGVYVPIDTDAPAPRTLKILRSCAPRFILAAAASGRQLDQLYGEDDIRARVLLGSLDAAPIERSIVRSTFCLDDLDGVPADAIDAGTDPTDPAHILFTSGSTGTPKGVVITHRSVCAFVAWALDQLAIGPDDRLSGHSPLHFDLSTFDVYGAFAAGAELHPVPPELNLLAPRLVQFVAEAQLTQWFSVPSILNYLRSFDAVAAGAWPSLRRLLWCGEVLPTATLCYLMDRLPHATFTNLYGPTEATIASSYHPVLARPVNERTPIPIGRACDGEALFVLDQRHEATPAGQIGDLYIGGVGLSPGYWRDDEKTAAAFVVPERGPAKGQRVYRTGDLARRSDDGLFTFVGRQDSQVKSRGYRIELGEIEATLTALGLLVESAVVAIDSTGFDGAVICCAYVPRPGATAQEIRRQLALTLPRYMIPSAWQDYEALPKNQNGKVDRPRLRQAFEQAAEHKSTR